MANKEQIKITVTGPRGAGKSTAARLIKDSLKSSGYSVSIDTEDTISDIVIKTE